MGDRRSTPEELRERANQYEELIELREEVKKSIRDMARSDLVDESTSIRLRFINQMLSIIHHECDWGYAAHFDRRQARDLERQNEDSDDE